VGDDFSDVLEANRRYAQGFAWDGLDGSAARGLAVLTCIDSRIEPLQMLGLTPGDAKIIRNAGARVTDDALRSLVLAANMLAAHRIMIVAHTDCALADTTDEQVRSELAAAYPGESLDGFSPCAMTDQLATLAADVQRVRECSLLPANTVVAGFRYDVESGLLEPVA
jgi:carbonic anhydrase